jgi:hypothetical protein
MRYGTGCRLVVVLVALLVPVAFGQWQPRCNTCLSAQTPGGKPTFRLSISNMRVEHGKVLVRATFTYVGDGVTLLRVAGIGGIEYEVAANGSAIDQDQKTVAVDAIIPLRSRGCSFDLRFDTFVPLTGAKNVHKQLPGSAYSTDLEICDERELNQLGGRTIEIIAYPQTLDLQKAGDAARQHDLWKAIEETPVVASINATNLRARPSQVIK